MPLLLLQALRKRAAEEGCEVVVVSAKVESELNGMPAEEAAEWLEMLGVEAGEGGGLAALIRATYKTLGLQTYFTTGTPKLLHWAHATRLRAAIARLYAAIYLTVVRLKCTRDSRRVRTTNLSVVKLSGIPIAGYQFCALADPSRR